MEESPTIKNMSHFFDSHTAGTAHLWFVNLCLAFGGDLKKPTTVGHSSTSIWNPNWESNGSTIVSLNLSNITSRPNNCILFEANSFLCCYTASVGFSATNPFLLIVCICMLSRAFRLLRVDAIFMHLHIFKVQCNHASEKEKSANNLFFVTCHFGVKIQEHQVQAEFFHPCLLNSTRKLRKRPQRISTESCDKSGAASRNPRAERTLINKSTSCDGR